MTKSKQKFGAGILFVTANNQALFLKRGDKGDHAGEWCIPGGHRDYQETMPETARREATEEVGPHPEGELVLWTRRQDKDSDMDFTTFVQRVEEPFTVRLSDEHVDWCWADIRRPPEPLHPACQIALDKFFLDELGVARAIAAGELTSPQRYMNVWLFDIRITGTGGAYRDAHKEHVWRNPKDYLNDEFLARCNGLFVVRDHPDSSVLNSEEFKKRIIGTVFLPYVKDDEVWGIAKIIDDKAVEEMRSKQLSTSPGVAGVGDNREELEDGTHVLLEEDPTLLDHIAVCDLGVWDREGPPSGVATSTAGENPMSDKTAEETAAQTRTDSETAKKEEPDKLLCALDAAMSKLDAMGKRMDAYDEEKAKAEKDRQAKKDRKKARKDRRDALRARRDSGEISEEESKELEGLEKKGGETMADKKSKKDKKDSAAEHAEKAKELNAAEREEEEKAAVEADRKDSQLVKELAARLDRAERTIAGPNAEDEAAMVDAQYRCDSVSQLFNERAPRPLAAEAPLAYRKRLLKPFLKHSKAWKDVNLAVLDSVTLANVEEQVYADARAAARSPKDIGPGQLREIVRTDENTGHRIREFVGDADACWGQFKSQVRKAERGLRSFNVTPSNARH